MKGRMDVISEVYESQMQINWYHDSSRTVLQQLNVIEGFLIMLSLNNFAFDFHEYILILNKSIKQKKNKKNKNKNKNKKTKTIQQSPSSRVERSEIHERGERANEKDH